MSDNRFDNVMVTVFLVAFLVGCSILLGRCQVTDREEKAALRQVELQRIWSEQDAIRACFSRPCGTRIIYQQQLGMCQCVE